jgi:hypothetical protein
MQLVEEGDALADQLDLLGVVELEAEGARRDRGGEGGERRPLLEHQGFQTSPFGEQGGGASDDAAADDDEVGGLGR